MERCAQEAQLLIAHRLTLFYCPELVIRQLDNDRVSFIFWRHRLHFIRSPPAIVDQPVIELVHVKQRLPRIFLLNGPQKRSTTKVPVISQDKPNLF